MFGLLVLMVLAVVAALTYRRFVDQQTRRNMGFLVKALAGLFALLLALAVFVGLSK